MGKTETFINTEVGDKLLDIFEKVRNIPLKYEGYSSKPSVKFIQTKGGYNDRTGNQAHYDYLFSLVALWNLSSLPVQFIPKQGNEEILLDIKQDVTTEYEDFLSNGKHKIIKNSFINYPNLVKTCPKEAIVFILGGELECSSSIKEFCKTADEQMQGVENAIIHSGLGKNTVGLSKKCKKSLEELPRSLIMFRTQPDYKKIELR